MFTSYFWRFHLKEVPHLVSIALKTPEWFQGRHYQALAPTRKMLQMCEEKYRVAYQKILNRLDPRKVYEDLGPEAVLLCWEYPGEFCHRRLVAEWLEKHVAIQVPELPANYDERQNTLF
jgi:hypothetical protein